MKPLWKLLCAIGVGASATALFAVPANADIRGHAPGHRHERRAVFVQNDALTGNTIIAYDRTRSGGLTQVGSYPTGGLGGQLSGSVVDHLASEGSLAYDRTGRLLVAVNAGSNTITTFAVAGDRLTRLQVLPSGGQFPVSVAVHGDQVFVLNARDGGSISGYLNLHGFLVPIPAWHRRLGVDTSQPGQSDEFTSTPGQIGFTPDGSQLVVSTKNGANTVDTFAVGLFGPSWSPTVTSLPGAVPFGFSFDEYGNLALTEAGTNSVATFTVNRDGTLTALDTASTGQAATCWIVTAGDSLYASNAGSGTLSIYSTEGSGALTGGNTAATDPGTVDAAASSDGRHLYVETGKNGILDVYRINPDGSLIATGSVTVPGGTGAEGIVAL